MDCKHHLTLLHQRHHLDPAAAAAFRQHTERCPGCAALVAECDQLDSLLQSWQAPDVPLYAGRVVRKLRRMQTGANGNMTCNEVLGQTHALAEQSLDRRTAERIESHLLGCPECAQVSFEAEAARQLWLTWEVPAAPEGIPERVVTRLQRLRNHAPDRPAPTASSPGSLRKILGRPLEVSRLAAAMLLVAAMGLAVVVSRQLPQTGVSVAVAPAPPLPAAPTILSTAAPLFRARPGHMDQALAFAVDLPRAGRGRLLHELREW